MASIRDFGAKGDGQADDTAAFRHAVEKSDGEVFLPRGTYRLTAPVVLPLDKVGRVGVRGDGTAKVVMAAAGPAFHLAGTHDKTALPADFRPGIWSAERMPHLSDFEIEGAHPQAEGVRLEGVMQATVRGMLIRRCLHGVHLVKRNRNVLIADCHVYDNLGVGVFLDAVNLHQININSCHISYCRRAGILVKGGEVRNIQIVGNDIEYNFAPDIDDCADVYFDAREGTIREGTVVGCTIQAKESKGGANVRLVGAADRPDAVGMLAITGNLIGSQETAVHLKACRGVTLTGNSIYSGYRQSVVVEDAEAVTLAGNVIDTNPEYKGTSTDAMRFVRSRNLVVSGLLLQHTQPATQEVEASVLFEKCERVQFTGCQVINGRTRALLFRGCDVANVTGCTLVGKSGDDTYVTSIAVEDGERLVIANNFVSAGKDGPAVLPNGRKLSPGNLTL